VVDYASIKEWYNQKHLKYGNSAWRPYEAYSIFLKLLKPVSSKKLLDVGCGTGFFLRTAAENGLETYGVDISAQAVKLSKQNSPSSNIKEVNDENLPFHNGFFDYVCCLGALEHFVDMDKGVKEFKRTAKPSAKFLIIVPNVNYIYWKITGKLGTEQQEINERLYPLKQWKSYFENHGFKIIKIYQDTWEFKNVLHRKSKNIFELFLRYICRFFYFLIPLRYTEQFIFVMERNAAAD